MPNYAIVPVTGGVVSNVVVGETKGEVEQVVGSVIEITEETGGASIGWIWDGTKFYHPDEYINNNPVE